MTFRRVVVTGLGSITPVGANVKQSWRHLLAGTCGIQNLDGEQYNLLEVKIGAKVYKDFKGEIFKPFCQNIPNKMNLFSLSAAFEAFEDSGWKPQTENEKQMAGIIWGGSISSPDDMINALFKAKESGFNKIDRMTMLKIWNNVPQATISIQLQLQGYQNCISAACSSGNIAIGEGFRAIQRGDADTMIVGGCDTPVNPFVISAFSKIGALTSKYNNKPNQASRPFDQNRSGFVLGEGAGALLLESLDHAKARKAKNIYCEIKGFSSTCDATHLTRSDIKGAKQCMLNLLKQANLNPDQIDLINAHATSTQAGDLNEATAISEVFQNASQLVITANKGNIGHLCGAAGVVESVFTIKSIKEGKIPPILNLQDPLVVEGSLTKLNFARKIVDKQVNNAINNSFAFGGLNTAVLFSKY